jgi:hypothetical protein
VVVVIMGGGGKNAIVVASTTATVNDAAICTVSSIPPPLPSTMTAIAAINDRHCHYHTVNVNNRQKPAVVVCRQRQQWRSLLMGAAVDGDCYDGGLCQRWLSLMKVAVGWRDNGSMASAAMASFANGGGGDGSHGRQLCSGGWCRRHRPIINITGGSKDAIAAAAINHRFHRLQLLLPPSTTAIVAAIQLMVNSRGGFHQ